jgi:hypothetical protein
MELVIGAVFKKLMPAASSGPQILLFMRFKKNWGNVDRNNIQPASTDPEVETLVAPSRDDILKFSTEQLGTAQTRDDYRELLELSVYSLVVLLLVESTFKLQEPHIMRDGCRKSSTP